MSEEEEIKTKLTQFAEGMCPLDTESAKILYDNLWDLYIKDENTPSQGRQSNE